MRAMDARTAVCSAGGVAPCRQQPACGPAGVRRVRGRVAGRASGKGYFSEADPKQGMQQLWGQQSKRDLIKEKEEGELLWNVEWEAQLNTAERERKEKSKNAAASSAPRGFLSLSRSMALDDLSVEIDSPVLQSSEPPVEGMTLAEGLAPLEAAFVPATGAPRYAPTRGERKRWSGNSKFTTGSTAKELEAAREGEAERAAAREADLARYATLKAELAGYTAGIAAVTTLTVAALYSGEAAGSYALGAAGGLLYLRLLARSVDSTTPGEKGISDVLEGTIGGQRLLVPAILVLGWNRWNALAAPVTGVELQIAPMLAGFFTYKIATLVQLFRDLLPRRSDEAA